jgi:hypothetical protein
MIRAKASSRPETPILVEPDSKHHDAKIVDDMPELRLLRSVFKRDYPYRCVLGLTGNIPTSASGTLNFSLFVSGISAVSEWSSIDALFDEFFIHSLTLHYKPYNMLGSLHEPNGGPTGNSIGVTTTSSTTRVFNTGAGIVSLFTGAGVYSSFASMLPNPTLRQPHLSKEWKYAWRNNVRFDPRGVGLSPGTGFGWQGWSQITAVSNYGGIIQLRATNDSTLGDGTNALNLAAYSAIWDVSFRARA